MLRAKSLLFLLLVPLIFGVYGALADTKSEPPQALNVFAAASLNGVFTNIEKDFEEQFPGTDIVLNFAGSQTLRLQIEQGAYVDVFASANIDQMQGLVDQNFMLKPVSFTENQMVLITPKYNPGQIQSLKDLTRPGLKLVLASEVVPAGRYARVVLSKLNRHPQLGGTFQTNVLRNLVSEEDSVKGVVTKVQLGEADAGIVYSSDVTSQLHALKIPPEYNVVATYPVAVAANSRQPVLAQQFVDFVLSPPGQALLARHNFRPVQVQALDQQP